MRKISAEIIADSKNSLGDRLTTFVVTFPRIILAEVNTHRTFTRNSASSRAIPFKKMVEMTRTNPFIPIAWQKDHSGMQGTEYFTEDEIVSEGIELKWLQARDNAVTMAESLSNSKATKQLCNRLLEPFMYHTAIITTSGSGLENYFKLRCPEYNFDGKKFRSKKDALVIIEDVLGESDFNNTEDYLQWASINTCQAEIHIQDLAELMWDCYKESEPKQLKNGEWHIPFGERVEESRILKMLDSPKNVSKQVAETKIKIATARCARVSYLNFEGKDDYEADVKLYDRLSKMEHWSPFEHCAKNNGNILGLQGNLGKGWAQHRKIMMNNSK